MQSILKIHLNDDESTCLQNLRLAESIDQMNLEAGIISLDVAKAFRDLLLRSKSVKVRFWACKPQDEATAAVLSEALSANISHLDVWHGMFQEEPGFLLQDAIIQPKSYDSLSNTLKVVELIGIFDNNRMADTVSWLSQLSSLQKLTLRNFGTSHETNFFVTFIQHIKSHNIEELILGSMEVSQDLIQGIQAWKGLKKLTFDLCSVSSGVRIGCLTQLSELVVDRTILEVKDVIEIVKSSRLRSLLVNICSRTNFRYLRKRALRALDENTTLEKLDCDRADIMMRLARPFLARNFADRIQRESWGAPPALWAPLLDRAQEEYESSQSDVIYRLLRGSNVLHSSLSHR